MAAPSPAHLNASSRLQSRTASPRGSRGSLTQTIAGQPDRASTPDSLVLRLRGAHSISANNEADIQSDTSQASNTRRRPRRRIQWDENVIDNEGLGRKKSKVCCIYHKPRPVGESSDESSSSSDSDSNSDGEGSSSDRFTDGARPVRHMSGSRDRQRRGNRRSRGHDHDGHHHGRDNDGECNGHGGLHRGNPTHDRRPSPNAYERMPRYDVKPLAEQPKS